MLALALPLLLGVSPARSETPEQWIELGAKVHGAFGAFIPVGIRIGLDAKERLKADARGLGVTYYSGEKAPCPCVADGVMIATQASPGQGTFRMASEKAPPGSLATIVIRNRKAGEGHSEGRAIGQASTPDLIGCFHHHHLAAQPFSAGHDRALP